VIKVFKGQADCDNVIRLQNVILVANKCWIETLNDVLVTIENVLKHFLLVKAWELAHRAERLWSNVLTPHELAEVGAFVSMPDYVDVVNLASLQDRARHQRLRVPSVANGSKEVSNDNGLFEVAFDFKLQSLFESLFFLLSFKTEPFFIKFLLLLFLSPNSLLLFFSSGLFCISCCFECCFLLKLDLSLRFDENVSGLGSGSATNLADSFAVVINEGAHGALVADDLKCSSNRIRGCGLRLALFLLKFHDCIDSRMDTCI